MKGKSFNGEGNSMVDATEKSAAVQEVAASGRRCLGRLVGIREDLTSKNPWESPAFTSKN